MISPEFVVKVLADTKQQTIRPSAWTVGEHYSLRRWKAKPYRSVQIEVCVIECTRTSPATVYDEGLTLRSEGTTLQYLAGVDTVALHRFALNDGFDDWHALVAWFRARYLRKAHMKGLPDFLEWHGHVNYFKRIKA